MVNARRLGQLGMLAVGLGIGSAMAATPGIASADNSQVVSSIDPSGLFPAADPAQSLDFQISIDGTDLFPTVGNSATAVSGAGDMAIAFGAGSQAIADGGYGDYATADGTDAFAEAGYGGGGTTGNNFDYASASGTDADAQAGDDPHSEFSDATTGNSFDSATASGNDATAYGGFNGSFDSAAASGNLANANAGDNGNSDFASAIGGNTDAEAGESGSAVAANDDTAMVLGNLITAQTGLTQAIAGGGFSLSNVIGDGGSNDTSFTTDPFGAVGSDAVSGLGNNFDLAGVFGDDYVANAFATSNLLDILPSV
jgi:hypothetical protein